VWRHIHRIIASTMELHGYVNVIAAKTFSLQQAFRTYITWLCMRGRCLNQNAPNYYLYGGRGIIPCKELDSFDIFLNEMGDRPIGMTLHRIDNDKGYYKDNCVWQTTKGQQRHRRINHKILAFGREQTLAAWAEESGLSPSTISKRLKRGVDAETAIARPSLGRGGGSWTSYARIRIGSTAIEDGGEHDDATTPTNCCHCSQ
jgi:hypothetical protein